MQTLAETMRRHPIFEIDFANWATDEIAATVRAIGNVDEDFDPLSDEAAIIDEIKRRQAA